MAMISLTFLINFEFSLHVSIFEQIFYQLINQQNYCLLNLTTESQLLFSLVKSSFQPSLIPSDTVTFTHVTSCL